MIPGHKTFDIEKQLIFASSNGIPCSIPLFVKQLVMQSQSIRTENISTTVDEAKAQRYLMLRSRGFCSEPSFHHRPTSAVEARLSEPSLDLERSNYFLLGVRVAGKAKEPTSPAVCSSIGRYLVERRDILGLPAPVVKSANMGAGGSKQAAQGGSSRHIFTRSVIWRVSIRYCGGGLNR